MNWDSARLTARCKGLTIQPNYLNGGFDVFPTGHRDKATHIDDWDKIVEINPEPHHV